MRGFYAALISGAVGIGALAAIAVSDPTPGDYTHCHVGTVYEDGSFTMVCPPIAEPDWGPDGFQPDNERFRHDS